MTHRNVKQFLQICILAIVSILSLTQQACAPTLIVPKGPQPAFEPPPEGTVATPAEVGSPEQLAFAEPIRRKQAVGNALFQEGLNNCMRFFADDKCDTYLHHSRKYGRTCAEIPIDTSESSKFWDEALVADCLRFTTTKTTEEDAAVVSCIALYKEIWKFAKGGMREKLYEASPEQISTLKQQEYCFREKP